MKKLFSFAILLTVSLNTFASVSDLKVQYPSSQYRGTLESISEATCSLDLYKDSFDNSPFRKVDFNINHLNKNGKVKFKDFLNKKVSITFNRSGLSTEVLLESSKGKTNVIVSNLKGLRLRQEGYFVGFLGTGTDVYLEMSCH